MTFKRALTLTARLMQKTITMQEVRQTLKAYGVNLKDDKETFAWFAAKALEHVGGEKWQVLK